jgi:pilus assembly protein CpaE
MTVPPSGVLMAVCGAKGGTGATTLAVHLALAVAFSGQRVCLIDLDLEKGDLPTFMNVQHQRSILDLVNPGVDLETAISQALFVHKDGPHLLLAPEQGEFAGQVTPDLVWRLLTALRARYDVVIADCGAHDSAGSAAVRVADLALVTVTPDLPAIRAARRLTGRWERLRIRPAQNVTVVLNQHDRGHEIQLELARKLLELPLLDITVPSAKGLESAANTGAPLTVSDVEFRKAVGGVAKETVLTPK